MREIKNIFYVLVLSLLLGTSQGVASGFYFTNMYGNTVDRIYPNSNNYLYLHSDSKDVLLVDSLICYKFNTYYMYNKYNKELKIYTNTPIYNDIMIYVKYGNKVDSISLMVVNPFNKFKINLLKNVLEDDTVSIRYDRSVHISLDLDSLYKILTKFEENIFLVSYIAYDRNKYPIIVKKNLAYRYELIIPYSIFMHKQKIKLGEAFLVIVPYSFENGNNIIPIHHKSVSYIVKLE